MYALMIGVNYVIFTYVLMLPLKIIIKGIKVIFWLKQSFKCYIILVVTAKIPTS